MWSIRLSSILLLTLAFGLPGALAQELASKPAQDLLGRYERRGVVDEMIEAQYRGVGPVLPRPVFIDALLPFPPLKWAGQDSEFIIQQYGTSGYLLILPQDQRSSALENMGVLSQMKDGTLLLSSRVVLAGEGTLQTTADQEMRFTKETRDGVAWLVVTTRIEWTKRSFFRSKKMEYRSVVRFREVTLHAQER